MYLTTQQRRYILYFIVNTFTQCSKCCLKSKMAFSSKKTTSSWYYLNRYLKIVSIFLFQSLNNKFNSVKNQVSDLHRDVTTRRCLTSYKQVENIVIDCASLTDEIEQTDQLMRERKELFHKMWEEEQQRITTEQTIFKAQVQCPNYKRSFCKSQILYRTPVCTFYKLHSLICHQRQVIFHQVEDGLKNCSLNFLLVVGPAISNFLDILVHFFLQ